MPDPLVADAPRATTDPVQRLGFGLFSFFFFSLAILGALFVTADGVDSSAETPAPVAVAGGP